MPVTINVNRLSLVHEQSGGVSAATLPNVCATPDLGLVAYPSTALSRDLAFGSRDVVADGGSSIAVRGARFAVSSGDEPGSLGGVKSRVHGAESSFLSWSLDVKIEGRNACRLTDKMLHNAANTLNCSGVTQPALQPGARATAAAASKQKRAEGYGLEVDVFYQPPTPAPDPNAAPGTPPPAPPARVPVDYAHVHAFTANKDVSLQGTTHPSTKHKNPLGTFTFTHLKSGRYHVDVQHDCLAEAPKEQDAAKPVAQRSTIKGYASVMKRPTKYATWMVAPDLKKAANEKGVILGARMDTVPAGDGRQTATVLSTFNDVIAGSFLASRSPDRVHAQSIADPSQWADLPVNRDLVDLTQQHAYCDFAPSPQLVDALAQQGYSVAGGVSYSNGPINFAQPNQLQIMVTPLVWPAPSNTPGWPCGTPISHLHPTGANAGHAAASEYIPFEQSYVYRRTRAQNKPGDAAAEARAAMEVHKGFITDVITHYKTLQYERPAFPGAAAEPWYVVVNECLNLRYSGAQANATADKDLARDHPLWKRFGLWDVNESRENLKKGFKDAIEDKTLWNHIRDCFVTAHAASEGKALLILNDYSVESFHPKTDFVKLARARDDADREVRVARQKAWKSAEARERVANGKARKARKPVDEKKYPTSKFEPNHKFAEAMKAAEIAFDKAVNLAYTAYVRDVQIAEDLSDGAKAKNRAGVDKEDQYKMNLKDAEKKYGDAVGAAKSAYGGALASATTEYQTAHDLAVTNKTLPAHADSEHKAIKDDAAERHDAASKYHKAVHAGRKRYWVAYHKAQIAYQKGYDSAMKKASGIYDHAEKPQLFYRLVEWLMKDPHGLPPAVKSRFVVGFQMHYPKSPASSGYDPKAIARNMRRYAILHVPVVVTELDVSHEGLEAIRQRPETNKKNAALNVKRAKQKDKHGKPLKPLPILPVLDPMNPAHQPSFMPLFRAQAERCRELIEACLSSGNCIGIFTWAVADFITGFRYQAYWFHPAFTCHIPSCPGNGPPTEYWRKPSYSATVSAFLRAPKQFSEAEIRSGKAAALAKKLNAADKGMR
jgi:Domain of unknown function (DUF4150)/Glycosyl hydrolase family 10